jgi:hypothetical protein
MRTLAFQQITDGRWDDPNNLLELLNERIEAIKIKLNIDGVQVRVGEPFEVKWDATSYSPAHSQFRADFYVNKATREVTWNYIYGLVNSVKAVSYKFIKTGEA